MKNEEWNCERCIYYGCPGDAPEGTKPDCMWESSEGDEYQPCSLIAIYVKKIQLIVSHRVDPFCDYAKVKEDLCVWLQCEWQCNGYFDVGDYMFLLNELDDLIVKVRSLAC